MADEGKQMLREHFEASEDEGSSIEDEYLKGQRGFMETLAYSDALRRVFPSLKNYLDQLGFDDASLVNEPGNDLPDNFYSSFGELQLTKDEYAALNELVAALETLSVFRYPDDSASNPKGEYDNECTRFILTLMPLRYGIMQLKNQGIGPRQNRSKLMKDVIACAIQWEMIRGTLEEWVRDFLDSYPGAALNPSQETALEFLARSD